jgi:predicted Zn-dependent protease
MAHRLHLLLLGSLLGFGQDPQPISAEKEAALGAAMAKNFRQRSKPLESAAAREMVERIGKRIAAVLPEDAPKFSFDPVVAVEGSFHEPASLPGGYVFVPSELFLKTLNEDEFAGMLAHAMAHCAARHGTRLASRGQVTGLTTIPLIFMGGWSGMHAQGAQVAMPLGFLTHQREFELEADRIAVKSMAAAGYDPAALIPYIERTHVDPARLDRSPLPPKEERLAAIRQAIADLPNTFEQVREEVRKLTAPPEKPDVRPTLRRPADPPPRH